MPGKRDKDRGVDRHPPTELLSVITPVRNMAAYLPDTLSTVAALSVPHEHIVIDGNSDDGTAQVLEARSDPNLHWVSEPDRGQTHAVNKGFERSRGDLLAWLNGDDAYVPDAVDRAVAHLRSNPETMAIIGGIRFVDAAGVAFRETNPSRFRWRRYLLLHTYLPTPTVIFRRQLLDRAGMLDETWADAADCDFYLRLLRDQRVDTMPEVLVLFRYHATSKTGSDVWRQHDEALQIRLNRASGPIERGVIRGYEGAKRAILPRISNWPQPDPSTASRAVGRLSGALHGARRR